ncbi:unnamed protein product [Brassica oleracea]
MLNQDDPKAKEDSSSSIGGDDTAMVTLSGDEANPRTIDKSVAPGTDQSPRDADESEENASGKKGEEEESSKKDEGEESREVDEGEKEKEVGDEREKKKEARDEGEKKELLETIGMDKESCWADDADDAAVDHNMEREETSFFEDQFGIDIEARTAKIEGPTNAIGGPSNNAESGQAHADSVEATGAKALKTMEGRLLNAVRDAVRDAMKEVNEKVTSLSNQLNLVEEEVKRLRLSGSDNPSDQDDGSDKKESEEEDGGDKESERDDGDGDGDGIGDVDMDDDDAEMYAHADEVERNLKDKAETENARTAKVLEKVRSSINTRRMAAEEAAEKRTTGPKK